MMRETHGLLRGEAHLNPIRNALIESFCVHARNLVEFFKNDDGCDFDPRWFTVDGYQLNKRFVGDSLLSRIARQIAHISRDRITLVHDKIDGDEQDRVKEAVEGELARLQQSLREEYRSKWKVLAPTAASGYSVVALLPTATTTTASGGITVVKVPAFRKGPLTGD
jgi:hypothetical protein